MTQPHSTYLAESRMETLSVSRSTKFLLFVFNLGMTYRIFIVKKLNHHIWCCFKKSWGNGIKRSLHGCQKKKPFEIYTGFFHNTYLKNSLKTTCVSFQKKCIKIKQSSTVIFHKFFEVPLQ